MIKLDDMLGLGDLGLRRKLGLLELSIMTFGLRGIEGFSVSCGFFSLRLSYMNRSRIMKNWWLVHCGPC